MWLLLNLHFWSSTMSRLSEISSQNWYLRGWAANSSTQDWCLKNLISLFLSQILLTKLIQKIWRWITCAFRLKRSCKVVLLRRTLHNWFKMMKRRGCKHVWITVSLCCCSFSAFIFELEGFWRWSNLCHLCCIQKLLILFIHCLWRRHTRFQWNKSWDRRLRSTIRKHLSFLAKLLARGHIKT